MGRLFLDGSATAGREGASQVEVNGGRRVKAGPDLLLTFLLTCRRAVARSTLFLIG